MHQRKRVLNTLLPEVLLSHTISVSVSVGAVVMEWVHPFRRYRMWAHGVRADTCDRVSDAET